MDEVSYCCRFFNSVKFGLLIHVSLNLNVEPLNNNMKVGKPLTKILKERDMNLERNFVRRNIGRSILYNSQYARAHCTLELLLTEPLQMTCKTSVVVLSI